MEQTFYVMHIFFLWYNVQKITEVQYENRTSLIYKASLYVMCTQFTNLVYSHSGFNSTQYMKNNITFTLFIAASLNYIQVIHRII